MDYFCQSSERRVETMIEYTLDEENYNRFFRRTITMIILKLGFLAVLYMGIISVYSDESITPVIGDLFLTFFIVLLINEIIKISMRKEEFAKFRIAFGGNSISVFGVCGSDLEIRFEDIVRITEAERGVFVQSNNVKEFIFIPKTINDYTGIKRRLSIVRPLEFETTEIEKISL